MEVTPGYKQTEVGLIPEEWEAVSLGDLKPFVTSGSRGWASFYSEHGSLFVRITNLSRKSIYLDLSDSKFVTLPPSASEGVRTRLKEHDVLISITADIGIVGYVNSSVPAPAYINQHIALVRFNQTKTCGKFVSYVLASENSQKLFRASTDVGAKAGLNLATVLGIQTALPPLPEQLAIVAALSEMDALLSGLDQLITKKRDLKQAAMQQLLTGKTRLPGFRGEWEVRSLDTITSRATGVWGMNEPDERNCRRVEIIRAGDISQEGRLTTTATRYIAPAEYEKAKCAYDDLIITTSGNGLGKLWWCDGRSDIAASNFVRVLHPTATKAVGKFLYYALRTGEGLRQLQEHTATSAYPNLRPTYFSTEWIPLPPLPEQSAIAEVLSDMDAELSALEARRDKTRALKQGMMQELLTGRTRLVKPEQEGRAAF